MAVCKRVLGHNFGVRGVCGVQFWWYTGPWGTIVGIKRALAHNFGGIKGLGAEFWGLKRALGLFFMKSSYAVTWGSLRMRSRPPPPM